MQRSKVPSEKTHNLPIVVGICSRFVRCVVVCKNVGNDSLW